MTSDIGYFFHSCWTRACRLLRNVYSLAPFSDQGLLLPALHGCIGPLDIIPLSGRRFEDTLSHCINWLSVSVDGFICCAELLNLMRSHLLIFTFATCVLRWCHMGNKSFSRAVSRVFLLCFLLRDFQTQVFWASFCILCWLSCGVLRQACAILLHSCHALF